jgi:hypothetical protein
MIVFIFASSLRLLSTIAEQKLPTTSTGTSDYPLIAPALASNSSLSVADKDSIARYQ